MSIVDLLQMLPLPLMFVATVALGLVLGWISVALVRLGMHLFGRDPQKPAAIPELVTVMSILFALMLSFSMSQVLNDWVQAQSAVQREALALDNILELANSLRPDRGASISERVIAYATSTAQHEWPAMSRRAEMDDVAFSVSDRILADLTAEAARNAAGANSASTSTILLQQILAARSARLARLTLANSGISGAQWFGLVALIAGAMIVVAMIYSADTERQLLAINLLSVAAAVAFFVILAHDRPFVGAISVSARPLLQLADRVHH